MFSSKIRFTVLQLVSDETNASFRNKFFWEIKTLSITTSILQINDIMNRIFIHLNKLFFFRSPTMLQTLRQEYGILFSYFLFIYLFFYFL